MLKGANGTAPSPAAKRKARTGTWTAWRSDRPPNAGSLVGWDEKAPLSSLGKRKPPSVLGEDHACLGLRAFPDQKRARKDEEMELVACQTVNSATRSVYEAQERMYKLGCMYDYGSMDLHVSSPTQVSALSSSVESTSTRLPPGHQS